MNRTKIISVIVASCFLLAEYAFPQNVVRGPYLQTGSPTSVIVRWRTDQASDSEVKFGSSPGSLNQTAENSSSTTEHEVLLSGLSPDTKYYYSIGTTATTLAGGDENHFFITSPVPGTRKSTRVWVLGDSGTKDSKARSVRDAYYNFTDSRHTDFWLMLGDNAYGSGTDSEYQTAVFENMYEAMLQKSVLWATLGNHDVGSSASPGPNPYHNIFSNPKNGEAGGLASGDESYYSFDYGNIHVICLNSTATKYVSSGSAMMTWLQADVAANDKEWTIAFWHHPPYSKGSHNSDSEGLLTKMREIAVPILEDGGVDLVLSGHSHNYERSFLLDGHYGQSGTLTSSMKLDPGNGRADGDGAYKKATLGAAAHEGAVYMVSGCSGKTGGGSLNHPAMFISFNTLGSTVLDVDGNRLDVTFVNSSGQTLDYFTMIKGDIQSGPATQLVALSGDGQSGLVGTTLPNPFVVQARDANNNPVAGVAVTFEITFGNGSLSATQQVTSASGRASTVLTFGNTPGTVTVSAIAPGLTGSPQIFSSTAIENPQPDTQPPAPPVNVRVVLGQ